MPPIDRSSAKECVTRSLKRIADFSGDVENFDFKYWHKFHKTAFIDAIATCISKKGSRIVLNEAMLDNFKNVGEFIDFVKSKSAYVQEPEPNLLEKDGNLRPRPFV
jgi:hypothetical protein